MFAPLLLFASLSTFATVGPVAQDEQFLYVVDQGRIARVTKSDPSQRLLLTQATDRRIAAIDVVDGRVYFATAPAPSCVPYPLFGPDSAYFGYDCSLTDTARKHELRSVATTGGDEQLLHSTINGITEIDHDDEALYWLEPSTGFEPAGGSVWKKRRDQPSLQPIAHGLVVSVTSEHPLAVAGDAVYVSSNGHLVRVPKDGGAATDVASIEADSSIAAVNDVVYYASSGRIYARHTSGEADTVHLAYGLSCGGYYRSVQAAAPGLLILTETCGVTGLFIRERVAMSLCDNSAQVLGSLTGSRSQSYFVAPLSEPPLAVDANGVWIGTSRVPLPFSVDGCRRRAVR